MIINQAIGPPTITHTAPMFLLEQIRLDRPACVAGPSSGDNVDIRSNTGGGFYLGCSPRVVLCGSLHRAGLDAGFRRRPAPTSFRRRGQAANLHDGGGYEGATG